MVAASGATRSATIRPPSRTSTRSAWLATNGSCVTITTARRGSLAARQRVRETAELRADPDGRAEAGNGAGVAGGDAGPGAGMGEGGCRLHAFQPAVEGLPVALRQPPEPG